MIDGFKKGSGCFTCELCGKKTRVVDVNMPYCPYCIRIMEKENEGEVIWTEAEKEHKKRT